MKRYDCAQGGAEWLQLHVGIPTASEFANLVTPEFKMKSGEVPSAYLAKKVAEAWLGGPLPGFTSFATDQGKLLEEEAIPGAVLEYGWKIDRVGFCTTEDGRIGCSPDGLLGEDSGLEIKCPNMETHVRYLLAGEVPDKYLAQVHGSMLVTGRPEWKFLSYRRRFPPLLITVARDEAIQAKLLEALTLFLGRFDRAMERMTELNGGPPPPKPATTGDPIKFSWEQQGDPDWIRDDVPH